VLAGENDNRTGLIDLDHQVRDELQIEVGLARSHRLQPERVQVLRVSVHVLHVGEALGA
jgi:hypothetical protein